MFNSMQADLHATTSSQHAARRCNKCAPSSCHRRTVQPSRPRAGDLVVADRPGPSPAHSDRSAVSRRLVRYIDESCSR